MPKPLDMELLAPAGGPEQLRAALLFGADAVYLAGKQFGMRARAANFSEKELSEAIVYAQSLNKRVYVTVNIVMNPRDMKILPAYLASLNEAGVDAFIIGDLGAASLARSVAPRVDIHVSTQASVSNAQAAWVWHEAVGATRVVAARELSLEDLSLMKQDMPSGMQLECFVHGAMCMAVSGRCLISSYLTGRSGNRGHCTQPCRWNYTLEEEKRPGMHFPIEEDERGSYILNAKDLNMLAHLDKLASAGIDSIKIEGRNKKAFYVASVVNAYRHVLDGEDPSIWEEELLRVSHRPYSTGFYFGKGEQAQDYDGYEQDSMHVADVVSCEQVGEGRYRIGMRCRNHFDEGETLEVLSPLHPICSAIVEKLTWQPEEEFSPDVAYFGEQGVSCANRSCNLYYCEANLPFSLPAGSFLRNAVHRRSARHDD
ncbi:MAG: U32 family peptidase [Eggerthellaceae bacterium]|nr:U32 family peptidase [Eggerthellaceae bacterium]